MTSNDVEELQLIHCSLLPGESLIFIDDANFWNCVLEDLANTGSYENTRSCLPHFQIHVEDGPIWFDVTLSSKPLGAAVLVKGDHLTRDDQIRWQHVVQEKLEEVMESEPQYPIYELLSSHLLPLLHKEAELAQIMASERAAAASTTIASASSKAQEIYHALFTSHHLISPNKRRSLQSWSNSLSIQGFAKVGYPGVIYAQGEKENIEEFVDNVKAMQWLALKLRFMEELPVKFADEEEIKKEGWEDLVGWRECEKVGEVVEQMRRIGREEYVVEMGIGSAGST